MHDLNPLVSSVFSFAIISHPYLQPDSFYSFHSSKHTANVMPPTPRILLLGGHGKVSLLMTPKLLSRSWNVTSVIRNPDQKAEILEVGKNGPGKIDVLIESLEDVKSDKDAKRILELVKPDWIIWSAGMFCGNLYFWE